MFDVCARVGSSGVGMVLGRRSRSGGGKPTSPQTLGATFLKALVGSRPPPSFWPPPPSPPSPLLSLPQVLQPPHSQGFCSSPSSIPSCHPLPSPLLQVSFFLSGSPSCGCKFRLENWWEEGRRKGGTQGDFVIIFCCICAAIKLIICLPMRIGRGMSRNFVGG
jgi:hypothetical protein